ncbi:type II toxin-antitoxin system mRNA interferase toxin, RelE/StbE family [Candidatus Peribacteria bacterium]|nr:type II toxin-antitoxin system mRNA interferase toxin, RelE/StbE family [Candidatus Peribacteria bacterium]
MEITRIFYDTGFEREFRKLPREIQMRAAKTENLFRGNPFHPSLRLHKLEGPLKQYWSISINRSYRIICKIDGKEAMFISIGTHSIYE